MPPQEGRGEVAGEVEVGAAGEKAAGDARPGGSGEPGLRELVDAEMGGDGTVEALVDEDLVALVFGDLGCCDLAGGWLSELEWAHGHGQVTYRACVEVVMLAVNALAML